MDINDVKRLFPEAYASFLTGWEDNVTGAPIKNHDQLLEWLGDQSGFEVKEGRLFWWDTFEGWQVWDGKKWEWCEGPFPKG